MAEGLETRGLDEWIAQLKELPDKLKEISKLGMEASLLALWENVPSYPEPPADSTYRRTGTLGRTLGSSEAGGKASGEPDIYEVRELGGGIHEGRFGTSLDYAPYVIGEEQSRHMAHWWKLTSVVNRAAKKITDIWNGLMESVAEWLEKNR